MRQNCSRTYNLVVVGGAGDGSPGIPFPLAVIVGPCEEVEREANRHSTGHCSVRIAGGGLPRIADNSSAKKVVQQTP
ncbi:hypothetical protein FOZ60_012134 [Perkinsus olseni]|uniref:Uncharacterized protein n=1 Tax=Perkinsus olseni TaxID=32597 RepID=A0A7J6NEK5_PEROL|nr:hypothetical protein FOZ60_012134 [Perkinsus olseni]